MSAQSLNYPWLAKYDPRQSLETRVPLPTGYVRTEVKPGSFADWLRHLPLKPGNPQVLLFDGTPRANQQAHFAVIDIDVGTKDLQQCADSVIRLRAEYLYSIGDFKSIHFNFTSGDEARFDRYAQGYRPVVVGNYVRWIKRAGEDYSYPSFRNYLNSVFNYAGSFSLSKEMTAVGNLEDMRIGDVFIRGGFPGHVIMVVDLAESPKTGDKIFLLSQGFIPAVEMHVLNNPEDRKLSPWYSIKFPGDLITPQYTFDRSELKRFPKVQVE